MEESECVACSGTGGGYWDGICCEYCAGSGEYNDSEDLDE